MFLTFSHLQKDDSLVKKKSLFILQLGNMQTEVDEHGKRTDRNTKRSVISFLPVCGSFHLASSMQLPNAHQKNSQHQQSPPPSSNKTNTPILFKLGPTPPLRNRMLPRQSPPHHLRDRRNPPSSTRSSDLPDSVWMAAVTDPGDHACVYVRKSGSGRVVV